MAQNFLKEKRTQNKMQANTVKNSSLVSVVQKPIVRLKQQPTFEFEEKMNMSITSFDEKEPVDLGSDDQINPEDDR
jgi:hypothetical protein